jgi:hypothetical protein
MNLFKSVVASAISSGIPNFPYTFGDRQDIEGGIWVLQNGQKRVRTTNHSNIAAKRAGQRLLTICYRMMDLTAVYSPLISTQIKDSYLWHEMLSRSCGLCGILA